MFKNQMIKHHEIPWKTTFLFLLISLMSSPLRSRSVGLLLGLCAGDRNGGPQRMALRVAEAFAECEAVGMLDSCDLVDDLGCGPLGHDGHGENPRKNHGKTIG